MALTDIKVRTAKPTDKQYKLTEGNDFYRGHDAVPLIKNTQHKCGKTYAEGRPLHHFTSSISVT
jgi:hypothetical protein